MAKLISQIWRWIGDFLNWKEIFAMLGVDGVLVVVWQKASVFYLSLGKFQRITLTFGLFIIVLLVLGFLWGYLKDRFNIGVNRKHNEQLISDVKDTLIDIDGIQQHTAINLPNKITKSLADNISAEFNRLFGKPSVPKPRKPTPKSLAKYADNLRETLPSDIPIFQRITVKRDPQALSEFLGSVGNILDSNNYGLKETLKVNSNYGLLENKLAKERLQIKFSNNRRKRIFQNNVENVCKISYGLNSFLRLREAMRYTEAPKQVKYALEELETSMRTSMVYMLDNLDKKWVITGKLNAS